MFLRQTAVLLSRALSALLLACAPLTHAAVAAPGPGPAAEGATGMEAAAAAAPATPYLRQLESAVAQLELDQGAYADGLAERLLSLGQALQTRGRHDEAIRAFKRGAHLARINGGLYSAEQIPLLQGEIASHIASGQFQRADERQAYLYRVQQRSLVNGTLRATALMQQARWQHRAYNLQLDEAGFARLLNMWDLYRLALLDIADREGETSTGLLEPLQGMLQAQYLISSYQPPSDSSFSNAGPSFSERQAEGRFWAYRAQSYERGDSIIRAMSEVRQAGSETGDPVARAESLVQMGDWHLWHDERDQAEQDYREAYRELEGLDDAQQHRARLFGEPRALPDIEGIGLLPPRREPGEGNILLQFGVTEHGKVVQMERLDEPDGNTGSGNRLMRQLRKTPFRPRFENGEPVATEQVVRAYELP